MSCDILPPIRLKCVRSIHEALQHDRCAEAVALLRAARDMWPDNDEFGASAISSEEEFMVSYNTSYFALFPDHLTFISSFRHNRLLQNLDISIYTAVFSYDL